MNVVLFGASGMVGNGVLQECLKAADVHSILIIGRSSIGIQHPKILEILRQDFTDFSDLTKQLEIYDACFYCLGVSSAGLNEKQYTLINYSYTIAAAKALSNANPRMTFIYVSGAGTDSTEKGRSMWARVKGRVENALLQMPFANVYLFRPSIIRPVGGVQSKTWVYRLFYTLLGPVLGLWQCVFPRMIATTETIGLAMLELVRTGDMSAIISQSDIYRWAFKNRDAHAS